LNIIHTHCALERPPAPAAAMDRVRHVCASVSCATAEKYDADRLCAGCRSVFYCCPECQRADWKGHKPACRVATAEREASQMVRVGKGRGSAPAAAAPERVGPPASQWVAGAARGEAEALYNLGCCYDTGEGVPQSYERAAKLFQQAAEQGHASAQHNLGFLYSNGKGVPKDVARGVALLKQAAAGGFKPAADTLRVLGEAAPPAAPGAAGAPQPPWTDGARHRREGVAPAQLPPPACQPMD